MRRSFKTVLLGAVASLVIAGAPAKSQEQQADMSEEQVRSFFDTMQQDTVEALETGDYERLLEWVQSSIADEAAFLVSNEFYEGDERKGFTVMSLDKEDMTRLGRMAVGVMSGLQGQPIEDYSLEVEVTEVTPIGTDAAAVTVEYVESGRVSAQAVSQSGGEQQTDEALQTGSTQNGAQQDQALQFEASAQCNHVIRRGEAGEELQIGLTNCEARTEMRAG